MNLIGCFVGGFGNGWMDEWRDNVAYINID
jgi:hypothetical protein